MLKFFYDSLDTVKTVKWPTYMEIIRLILLVIAFIVVGALFFIVVDQLISQLYTTVYYMIKG